MYNLYLRIMFTLRTGLAILNYTQPYYIETMLWGAQSKEGGQLSTTKKYQIYKYIYDEGVDINQKLPLQVTRLKRTI